MHTRSWMLGEKMQYEYAVVVGSLSEITNSLNLKGEMGWRAINICEDISYNGVSYTAFLIRELEN